MEKMAGIRDKIIHHYFNIEYEIVWDAIKNKPPALKEKIQIIFEQEYS